MSTYRIEMGVLLLPAQDGADVDAFTDALIDALVALDPTADVQGSLATGEFQILVTVEAAETFDAVERARVLVRIAAHAAGARTANWRRDDDVWSWLRPTGAIHADPAGALATR
jgi:hypothetical protein